MTAIDVHSAAVGSPAVPEAFRSDHGLPRQPSQAWVDPAPPAAVPAHRWQVGWIGRGDHALLVLAELAAVSCEQVLPPTAGELTVADGVAIIRTPGGTITLQDVEDDMVCGPCTLARWMHALDVTVVYQHGRVVAAVIARAAPLTTDITRRVPLLPPIARWGPTSGASTCPPPT